MRTLIKVLVAVFAAGLLLLVGGVGFGVYWWRTHKDDYVAVAKVAVEEGASFGRAVDNRACLDSALSRHKQSASLGGSIKTGLFLRGCLKTSRATPGFCADVPAESGVMKTVGWRLAQCQKAALNGSYCQQVVGQVQRFCHLQGKQ